MPRFDPNLRWLFTEWPMSQRYAAAAACGFKAIEVAFPYDQPVAEMRRLLGDNGLALVQILTPLDWDKGERGIACVPGREADFRASVDTAITYALGLDKPLVHAAIGTVPKGVEAVQCHTVLRENLAYACDQARLHDITIIVEAVCRARFGTFLIHTLDETLTLIAEVGRPNLKLCFDTYHVQMEEGALTESLERVWPHVGHIQIGNPPGRNEPGAGELDLGYFLDLVDRKGWGGWVGLEYTPSAHTHATLAWAARYGISPPSNR